MTRKFFAIATVALLGLTSLTHAGDRERKIFRALLFPPIPVPVGNKVIDANSIFRTGRVKSIDLPKIKVPVPVPVRVRVPVPVPSVRVTVRKPAPAPKRAPVRLFYVTERPPRAPRECLTRRPSHEHVWVSGHWLRYGKTWVWANGRWAAQPVSGARWHDGAWQADCHGWQWVEGYWEYPRRRGHGRHHHHSSF